MITILMATYNGQKFIAQQIQSILNQTYPSFKLLIRDDGSKDDTLSILKSFAQQDERIVLLNSTTNLGIKGNFSHLMEHATSDYILFSDQDDVWLPNKIRLTYDKMCQLEKTYGSTIPLLVHTDLQVVNTYLDLISPSFWKYSHLNPLTPCPFNRLLVQNVVTGCTMMINRPTLELSYPIPSQTLMHDWWIALVASVWGYVVPLHEQTILYRQHGSNEIGAKKYSYLQSINNLFHHKKYKAYQAQLVVQATAFLERYSSQLTLSQIETIEALRQFRKSSLFKRVVLLYKYRLFANGIFPNLKRLIIN